MITQKTIAGTDFLFAQQCADTLGEFFPGWKWSCCKDGGVLYIKNLTLHGQWGMILKAQEVDKRRLLAAGGEFLDRFSMPYRFDQDAFLSASRDFTGSVLSEKWTPDRRFWRRDEKRWKA